MKHRRSAAALLTLALLTVVTTALTSGSVGSRTGGTATAATAAALEQSNAATSSPAVSQPIQLGIAAGGTLQFTPKEFQLAYLDAMQDLGATWLRFDFTWADIQRSNASTYDWARYDTLVAEAKARGIQVVGMLGYSPTWAQDPVCAGSSMCRPKNPAQFGTFAGAAAAHFKSRGVHYWEIWNEENISTFFLPAPSPAYYTKLLKAAYPKIHAADHAAKVITGGTSPAVTTTGGDYAPVDFLTGIYAAGGHGFFDILGHHPYCWAGKFNCPATQADWSAWSQMQFTKVNLRGVMKAHGDGGKQLWATEFGAPTHGPGSVTETQQANNLSAAVQEFAAYSWSGPLFLYTLTDLGTDKSNPADWFGLIRGNGSRKPAFAAVQTVVQQSR